MTRVKSFLDFIPKRLAPYTGFLGFLIGLFYVAASTLAGVAAWPAAHPPRWFFNPAALAVMIYNVYVSYRIAKEKNFKRLDATGATVGAVSLAGFIIPLIMIPAPRDPALEAKTPRLVSCPRCAGPREAGEMRCRCGYDYLLKRVVV